MTLVGTRIRHIRILRRLGGGGMGEVYEGRDEKLQRGVAVKVLRDERRLDPEAKRRFLREARILSAVDHPNICRVLDFIETGETEFIVLELVDGSTLDETIGESPPPPACLAIADQIVRGLAAAHGLGIVHRDLKPSNIMVTRDGTVKILDFGLARTVGDGAPDVPGPAAPASGDQETFSRLTRGRFGTPRYMSPEQARGEPVTAASDMYALGLILQELFTGRGPYPEGITREQLIQKAMWGDSLPVLGLDRGLTRLVEDLKAMDPLERPSATGCLERLRWIRDAPRRRLRRVAGVAVALALVVATVVSTVGFVRARRARVRAEASEAAARRAETRAVAVNAFLVDMLAAANPRRMGRDVRVVDILDQASEMVGTDFERDPLTAAAIHHTLGVTFHALGRLDRADRHLARALAIRSRLLDPASEPVIRTRIEVGRLLGTRGRLDEAEALLAGLRETCDGSLGEADPACLACATEYGRVLGSQRKFRESIGVLERVHRLYGNQGDPGARLEADIVLARSLREEGRMEEAESILSEVAGEGSRILGEAHPTTLSALQSLGVIYDYSGRHEEADELFGGVLERCAAVYGPDHPATLRANLNVGVMLCRLKRWDRAEVVFRSVVPRCEEKLGPVHPTTLEARRGLGYALSEQEGREAEAEAVYRERFDDTRRLLGPDHRVTLEAQSALASLYAFVGRPKEAESIYREVLATRLRVFGEDHPATLRSRRSLARLLRTEGREAEAAALVGPDRG